MSHPYFANCTQCHVPSDGLKTLTEAEEDRLVVTSFFHGRGQPGRHSQPPPLRSMNRPTSRRDLFRAFLRKPAKSTPATPPPEQKKAPNPRRSGPDSRPLLPRPPRQLLFDLRGTLPGTRRHEQGRWKVSRPCRCLHRMRGLPGSLPGSQERHLLCRPCSETRHDRQDRR